MTGRRLYDKYTDALKKHEVRWTTPPWPERTPLAWAFLRPAERSTWNSLAASIAPRPRKRQA